MSAFLWKTYRAGQYGGVAVHGFKVQRGGVLDGQTLKHFIDSYDSVEAALAAHPDAVPGGRFTDPVVSLSHLPGEDDPVPGGMYPDDIGEWPPQN